MKHHQNIYILGGHKIAKGYYQQILKGREQGKIDFENVLCISQKSEDEIRKSAPPSDWINTSYADFLFNNLDQFSDDDLLIPDHTAKHVMLQLFIKLIEHEFNLLNFIPLPLCFDFKTPFVYESDDKSIRAVSHATWSCPPECDEPTLCPHIKSKRTWELFSEIETLKTNIENDNTQLYRFGCEIFVDQIGGISFLEIKNELSRLRTQLMKSEPQNMIVATHSHCHGIFGGLQTSRP